MRSYAVRTEDGRVFWRNRRHIKKYDPPPATHPPEVEVGPSKITVTAEGPVKDSEEPPIQPPHQVSADVSTPPSSSIVPAPAPVKDPPVGVAAASRSSSRHQIKLLVLLDRDTTFRYVQLKFRKFQLLPILLPFIELIVFLTLHCVYYLQGHF